MKTHPLLFVPILFYGLSGCKADMSADRVLAEAIHRIKDSSCIQYTYISSWDNRFNGTTYTDSAAIIYAKVKPSTHGFAFRADRGGNTLLFDGVNYVDIHHQDKKIIRYDTAEIKRDTNYFSDLMIFAFSPQELIQKKNFTTVVDTVIDQRSFFVFREVDEKPSISDSKQIVRHERMYYIDQQAKLLWRIRNISILDQDTLQLIDCQFKGIQFPQTPPVLSVLEQPELLSYQEINSQDWENEQESKTISAGKRLPNRSYQDIHGNEVLLFGKPGQKSLIMFSFIGCGGCEYVLREMKNQNFQIKEGIDFFYSNPVDNQKVIATYLARKDFPFSAFCRESMMNDVFSVSAFPTFVLVNAEGLVLEVLNGYNDRVKEILF